MKNILLVFWFLSLSLSALGQEDIWDVMDGPYGGEADIIAVDSAGGVYAGTQVGVYRFDERSEEWKFLGFKGKEIKAIIIKPNGEGVVFAHGGFVGIYNPEDTTWREFKPRIKNPDGSSDSIPVWPHSATVIDSNIYTAGSFDICHSTDGIKWHLLNLPAGRTSMDFSKIGVNTKGILFLAEAASSKQQIVYFSKDTGKTWQQSLLPDIKALGDFNIKSMHRGENGRIFISGTGRRGGIYCSEDDGITWERLTTEPTWQLSINSRGKILANSEKTYNNYVTRLSKDWGNTWQELFIDERPIRAACHSIDSDGRIYVVQIKDIDQAFNISCEIIRSNDEGKTWKGWPLQFFNIGSGSLMTLADGSLLSGGRWRSTDEATWKPHAETGYQSTAETVINANGDVFTATGDGVYRSLDNGKTWEKVFSDGYYMLDIATNKRGWIYAAGEFVVWWSKDNGKTWETNDGAGDGKKTVACDYRDWIYSGFGGDTIIRSKDYGETWEKIQVIDWQDNPMFYYDIAFDRKHRILLGTVARALLRSDDSYGESYTEFARELGSSIREINIDSSGNIYIDGADYWRSQDDAESWQFVKGNDIDKIRGFGTYPAPSGHVYIGASTGTYKSRTKQKVAPFLAAREQGCGSYKVLIIGDTLQSVTVVDSLLSNVSVTFDTITPKKSVRVVCTLIDNSKPGRFGITAVNSNGMEQHYNDILFTPLAVPVIAQNDKTLLSSPARRYQWFLGDSLLYNDTAQIYKPKKSGNYKVRITDTNWCDAFSEPFAYTTVGTGDSPADHITTLNQNHPNPFSEKTEISYTLATSGKIRLTVLDIFGNTIAVADEGFKESGSYTAEFVTKNIPSGVYFYRLEAEGKIFTKQMSVVR